MHLKKTKNPFLDMNKTEDPSVQATNTKFTQSNVTLSLTKVSLGRLTLSINPYFTLGILFYHPWLSYITLKIAYVDPEFTHSYLDFTLSLPIVTLSLPIYTEFTMRRPKEI